MDRGAEFLLMHRLFRADYHQYKVINRDWLKFTFPCFFYDVLRGLLVVTKLGCASDERIDDALEILLQKQSLDGKWTLEKTYSGRMHTSLGKRETPQMVTLNALRVLKRVYQSRPD